MRPTEIFQHRIVTMCVKMRCEDGKAPTEAEVEAMEQELEHNALARKLINGRDDRYAWQPGIDWRVGREVWYFGIFRDYD